MTKMLFAVAFAVVCACATQAQALAIPKFDKTCLPTNAAPLTNFKPEQFFDGKNWYAIAGPIPTDFVNCTFINATFDATSKNVTVILTISVTIEGATTALISTHQFTQDAVSNAVYHNEDDDGQTMELAVLDTDYTGYTVMAPCIRRPGDQQAFPVVFARTPQKPSNYDAIVAKLTTAGFQTDSADFGLFPIHCPK